MAKKVTIARDVPLDSPVTDVKVKITAALTVPNCRHCGGLEHDDATDCNISKVRFLASHGITASERTTCDLAIKSSSLYASSGGLNRSK